MFLVVVVVSGRNVACNIFFSHITFILDSTRHDAIYVCVSYFDSN